MGWDEVCVLCGIRPVCGPTAISPFNSYKNAFTSSMATEISESGLVDISYQNTYDELLKVISPSDSSVYKFLVPLIDLGYRYDVFAIGHFDESGDYEPCTHSGYPSHPTGDGIVVRRVREGDGQVFYELVIDADKRVVVPQLTCCRTGVGWPSNIFCHVACYAYLQEWLQCTLPSRIGRLGKPLELAGELYELTNSRHEPPTALLGALPSVDYGGVLDNIRPGGSHDYVDKYRKGSVHTIVAFKNGARGEKLLSAILKDCRLWLFTRPDIWPKRRGWYAADWVNRSLSLTPREQTGTAWTKLPAELLPEILQHLDVKSLLALASSCKIMYSRLLDEAVLPYTLRRMVSNKDGALRWLPPVESLREEWQPAYDAMSTWLGGDPNEPVYVPFDKAEFDLDDDDDDDEYVPDSEETDTAASESDDDSELDHDIETSTGDRDPDEDIMSGPITDVPVPPVQDGADDDVSEHHLLPLWEHSFPIAAFVRTCYESDSMRSRQRHWYIIKQFDVLWSNYRQHGWERDAFVPEGVDFVLVDGRLKCSCSAPPEETQTSTQFAPANDI